jgi:uncharacterized membrane protein YfcA
MPHASFAHLAGLSLALLVGLALGLLGGGGSILAVPIFIYVLGVPPKPAIAMSLAVVGVTSFAGFLSHWRQRNVNGRVALLFGGAAVVGAFTGARVSKAIPSAVQLALFAVFALTAAWFMFRSGSRDARAVAGGRTRPPGGSNSPATSPGGDPPAGQAADTAHPVSLAAIGLGVGLLTSIIGAGGGFLIVPALVLLAGLPMRQAIGTSLLVLTANALSGFAGYLGQQPIDWPLLGSFITVSIVGIVVGSALVGRVPQPRLKQAFAVLIVVLGLFVALRSLTSRS